MYYKAITRRKPDQIFSKYVRLRDRGCAFQAKCHGRQAYEELACCHFHSRRKESVRFDPENCDAGCAKCHHFIDQTAEGKKWFREFKLKQLGQRAFDLLQLRAETPAKRDDTLSTLYVRDLLGQLEAATPLSELGYVPRT